MNLEEMRLDCAIKQKKGLHFIIASVLIWIAIFVVQLTDLPMITKNFITFCFTPTLVPLSFFVSKLIHVDFQNKENPLTNLGVIFSVNQMLYLLIAMWVYPTIPDKMLMVMVIIFGAHLMPYGWLYQSKTYMVLSVMISILGFIVGLNFECYILALMMIMIEVGFCVCLSIENHTLVR